MSALREKHAGIRWLWLSLLVVIIDQVSKAYIASHLQLSKSIRVLPVFNIVLYHNTGAAFSFLANQPGWQRWFFILLGLIITVGIVLWMWRLSNPRERLLAAGLGLVAGGALGNVVDRIRHGYVIDFIEVHYHQWYFPAFNAADSAITLGVVALFLSSSFLNLSGPGRK